MSYKLSSRAIEDLKKLLAEKGYLTQISICKKLSEEGFYDNSTSSRGFLNQVLNRKRGVPSKLKEGIYRICDNDPRLDLIFNPTYSDNASQNVPDAYATIFINRIDTIQQSYLNASNERKAEIIHGLEQIVARII